MKSKEVLFFLLLSALFLFSCCKEEIDDSFPQFEPIEVTDSMYFFFNSNKHTQFVAVDLSSDKIVKRYKLDPDKNLVDNFIYVKEQKKCYFAYSGHRDKRSWNSLAEFNPATAEIKYFDVPVLGSSVFPIVLESDYLLFMDNYNEKIYRYYYETNEFITEPYKFLGSPFEYDGDIYIVAADSIYDTDIQRDIYNWTKQKDMKIDLNEIFPDLLDDYVPNETFHFVSFFKKGIVGKRKKDNKSGEYKVKTTLYKLEEFGEAKFKISEPLQKLDVGCYANFEYGDYLYFNTGEADEDILKYDPEANEILDSFRNHYPNVEEYDLIISREQFYQVGKYLYTINSGNFENPAVLKINLENFSTKVIE